MFTELTGLNVFDVNLAMVILFCFIVPFILLVLKKQMFWIVICYLIGAFIFYPITNGFYKGLTPKAWDIVYNYGVLIAFMAVCFIGNRLFALKKNVLRWLGIFLSLISVMFFGYLIVIWSLVGL